MKKIETLEKHLTKMGYKVLYNGDDLLDVSEEEDGPCIFSIIFDEDSREIIGLMFGRTKGFISMDIKNITKH